MSSIMRPRHGNFAIEIACLIVGLHVSGVYVINIRIVLQLPPSTEANNQQQLYTSQQTVHDPMHEEYNLN